MKDSTSTLYIHTDHLGSSNVVTDQNNIGGAVVTPVCDLTCVIGSTGGTSSGGFGPTGGTGNNAMGANFGIPGINSGNGTAIQAGRIEGRNEGDYLTNFGVWFLTQIGSTNTGNVFDITVEGGTTHLVGQFILEIPVF